MSANATNTPFDGSAAVVPKIPPARWIFATRDSICWSCGTGIPTGRRIFWQSAKEAPHRCPDGRERSPIWCNVCALRLGAPNDSQAGQIDPEAGTRKRWKRGGPKAPDGAPAPDPNAPAPIAPLPPSREPSPAVPIRQSIPLDEPSPSRNGKPASGSDDLASIIARAIEGKLALPTGAPLDETRVRELAREEASALVKAQPATRIEIVLPDRAPIDVSGEHESYPLLVQLLGLGENVYLGGPMGSGKTTAAEKAGAALGLEVFLLPPCSDPVELLGYRDAGGNYQPTPLYRWATCECPALLVIDELDRSSARALLAMNAALANGWAVFPVGQVKIPSSHRVCATANTWGAGASAEYVGSARQDAALLNRFTARLGWDYDPKLEERLAVSVGGTANGAAALKATRTIRSNLSSAGIKLGWSPRDLMALAKRLAAGMPREQALAVSALATLGDDQRRKALERV